MNIYIDESGAFKAEPTKTDSISCVVALIVPETQQPKLIDVFNKWSASSNIQNKKNKFGEVKGSQLNEDEISNLLQEIAKLDLLVEVVCVDLGATTPTAIEQHKTIQAKNFNQSPTGFNFNLQEGRDVLKTLSHPLYVQSLVLFRLMHKVLEVSLSYYAQRLPKELGNFNWILDAKHKDITKYEQALTFLVKPFLQSISLHNPTYILAEADYSAFSNYFIHHERIATEYSKDGASYFDISEIMKNISFEQSHNDIGLQIADILANCIRRAMIGNLQFHGWKYLAKLIVLRKKQAIQIIDLVRRKIAYTPSYANFVTYFYYQGKQMLLD